MLSVLEEAMELASLKIKMIPNRQNSKVPAIEDWPKKASCDPEQLHTWFDDGKLNSGIVCGKVGALWIVGIDIDQSPGKDGMRTLSEFEDIGLDFPTTWTQKTARGGYHRLYWSSVPIRQGTNVLGPGVDVRCEGGQLVGPGSSINGSRYEVINRVPFVFLPDWVQKNYTKRSDVAKVIELRPKVTISNQILAMTRSLDYLRDLPIVIEGERNHVGYKTACKMKDFGLEKDQIKYLMENHWKCEPSLDLEEISLIVDSAFKTGKSTPGFNSPEAVFEHLPREPKEEKEDFIDEMNRRFFFCADNGTSRVCEEMVSEEGFKLKRHSVKSFHELLLSETIRIQQGTKSVYIQKSKEWMASRRRRTYDRIRFLPKTETSKDVYNLWRGFPVKPSKESSEKGKLGFEKFLEHCKKNICSNDETLFNWLMGYAAHMFQKTEEKPPVSIVFQGLKGVGKNVFVDVLKHLIGPNSCTISGKHALTSHFNSVFEDKILVAFDEAFWSGDKSVEGTLKSIITDSYRVVERKGEEPYSTKVYDRIFILGNEDRLVNATGDERRFAVFTIAPNNINDFEFFGEIKDGILKHGGDALLMDYFLTKDLIGFNPGKAPPTPGLTDQKIESLSDFNLWWFESLLQGRIIGDIYEADKWPDQVVCGDLISKFLSYEKETFKPRRPTSKHSFGKKLRYIAPSCGKSKLVREGTKVKRYYVFCPLEKARKEWNHVMKLNIDWENYEHGSC